MGTIYVILFTFLLRNKKKLLVIEGPTQPGTTGDIEELNLQPTQDQIQMERRARLSRRTLQRIPEEPLTSEEAKSRKRMVWLLLFIVILIFMILHPLLYTHILRRLTKITATAFSLYISSPA